MIRRLALTVSDVCLILSYFQGTSTYSTLKLSHYAVLYKLTTYLHT